MTARDVDPESDGVFIQGEVKARDSYRQSMRSRIEPVNALAKRFIRIYNTLDLATQATNEIVPNYTISVSGHVTVDNAERMDVIQRYTSVAKPTVDVILRQRCASTSPSE